MFRGTDKWLAGYLRAALARPRRPRGRRHLIFCVADHFEPLEVLDRTEAGVPAAARAERMAVVENWAARYPAAVGAFRDADGRAPRHTFFCSPNDYDADWMARLAALSRQGFAEVELHLHHRHDTAEGLREKLTAFRDRLRGEHGLLGSWGEAVVGDRLSVISCQSSVIAYGFIHGNWALCNSRPDGDWCGVNEELTVLRETGCYADFTFPSAPSPTQPRMVNAIYRAQDRPGGRGADAGVRCSAFAKATADEQESGVRRQGTEDGGDSLPHSHTPTLPHSDRSLMIVTGPLALDWRRRKWGVLPRLDNGGITHHNPPTPARVDLWVRQHVHVRGRPEWVFVKVHCHGTIPSTSRLFLGEAVRRMHAHLRARYNDGRAWTLHYATAREMYNIVRAAEDGKEGDPGAFRDYEISRPPCAV